MNFRLFLLSICCLAALAGFGVKWDAANASSQTFATQAARSQLVPPVVPEQADLKSEAFREELISQVLPLRIQKQFPPLWQNDQIGQWLSAQEKRLNGNNLDSILASAEWSGFLSVRAAWISGGPLRGLLPELVQKMTEDASARENQYGLMIRSQPDGEPTVILITGETTPELDPANLDQATNSVFTSQCPHCGKRTRFHHEKSGSTLYLECPQCGLTMRLLGRDTKGNYHDAPAFLIPSAFPTVAAGTDPLDAMISIWQAAVRSCYYLGDSDNHNEPTDFWQTPRQTLVKGTGDCEDSALLLTDWMLSNKIPARMALGTTADGGHAWCIVRVQGTDYLLESTNRHPDLENLPAVNPNDGYTPTVLVDREALYVRAHPASLFDGDYWSPEKWRKVPRAQPIVTKTKVAQPVPKP